MCEAASVKGFRTLNLWVLQDVASSSGGARAVRSGLPAWLLADIERRRQIQAAALHARSVVTLLGSCTSFIATGARQAAVTTYTGE